MENAMDNWYEAIRNRVSVRKYSEDPTREEYRTLRAAARYMSTDEVRIVVGKREGALSPLIGRSVSGTDTFAALVSRSRDNDYMVGMCGESFVLECTAMGLGTCWLGMSYNKGIFNSCVDLDEDESVRCVIAIGHYDSLPNKKRTRKTIFNLTGLDDKAFRALPEWQQTAINSARLAPSAVNGQPWEFDILNQNNIQIAKISKNFGYGELDIGIAMLHIEVGAAHCGVFGDWEINDGLPLFTADYSLEG